jgi:glycosyltransferase involved in cell wall biosynthesis
LNAIGYNRRHPSYTHLYFMQNSTKRSETILFTCGREPGYPRNRILLNLLDGSYHLIRIVDPKRFHPGRYLQLFFRLLAPHRKIDLIMVGFYGQVIMFMIRLLFNKPVIFDVFVSTYEVYCHERKHFKPNSLVGRFLLWVDKTSCSMANLVLLHTKADFQYFVDKIGIPPQKLRLLYIGCDETIFFPRNDIEPIPGRVLFYGSFIPNQGVDSIIRAAVLLKGHEGITFRLIGRGMELEKIKALARHEALDNVEFIDPMPLEQIAEEVAMADIILTGEFGDYDKARRVISSKTFQCMAMAKPFIAGDNAANREILTHQNDCLLSSMNDPADLAVNIIELINKPHMKRALGKAALKTYRQKASTPILRDRLESIINELL